MVSFTFPGKGTVEFNMQTESKITEAKAATVVNGNAGKEELEKDVDLDIVECL